MKFKAAVITFPGSNCDDDCRFALEAMGFETQLLWHKDVRSLSAFKLVVLPGGFSYGDYLRSGAMAAVSPCRQAIVDYSRSGGLLLGTCNGFQILCEIGLLPGALLPNQQLTFVCKAVGLNVLHTDSPWTCALTPGQEIELPIAHGDGRYFIDESQYQQMREKGQVLLEYLPSEEGAVSPNGSFREIAGVCDESRRVFGLMPHPERATTVDSRNGRKDGVLVWKSVLQWLEGNSK